jgi:hypothetical protein
MPKFFLPKLLVEKHDRMGKVTGGYLSYTPGNSSENSLDKNPNDNKGTITPNNFSSFFFEYKLGYFQSIKDFTNLILCMMT